MMAETKTGALSQAVHPLIERARTSTVLIAALIGFDVEEIGAGRAIASLQTGPQHANPMGTLHGGVLCDLADAAMGMAFVSTLAPEESFVHMRRPARRTGKSALITGCYQCHTRVRSSDFIFTSYARK
jgi:acyl-coenzyme A thioesterase PaaI-like protein